MQKNQWRKIAMKSLPYGLVLIIGLVVSFRYGSVIHSKFSHGILSLAGVIFFVVSSIIFLRIVSDGIRRNIVARHLGVGRAASLRFIVRTIGYLTILIVSLERLGIQVGHILVGSAVLGIILGVAAQQALANFFASIMLILVHPFRVGQRITLVSGALGGNYQGIVEDIGVTHTRLRKEDGEVVELPNSTILTSAAITVHKHKTLQQDEKVNTNSPPGLRTAK